MAREWNGEREKRTDREQRNGRRKKKVKKTKSRAEHIAVKRVADGIIGSFLSPCTTRPRFSFTSTSCHFVLARDGYRVTYSFVCALKIYDRLIDTWKRGGERLVNFPTDRSQLPPRTISSSSSSSSPPGKVYFSTNLYIFKFAAREMRPRDKGEWLLIFCKRRRPLCIGEILVETRIPFSILKTRKLDDEQHWAMDTGITIPLFLRQKELEIGDNVVLFNVLSGSRYLW